MAGGSVFKRKPVALVALFLIIALIAIPLVSQEKVPDYKNMKFEIGFTPNALPTPYKNGGPQLLKEKTNSYGGIE